MGGGGVGGRGLGGGPANGWFCGRRLSPIYAVSLERKGRSVFRVVERGREVVGGEWVESGWIGGR